jgi:hypothetical protein
MRFVSNARVTETDHPLPASGAREILITRRKISNDWKFPMAMSSSGWKKPERWSSKDWK